MAQNGPKQSRQTGPKWPTEGPNSPKMTQNGWSKMTQNGLKWPRPGCALFGAERDTNFFESHGGKFQSFFDFHGVRFWG